MGIDGEAARFLLAGRQAGVSYRRCATLGRMNYFLGRREMASLLREYGLDPGRYPKLFATGYSPVRYAEDFWEMLGAEELVTVDASDFEGATRVHDLNRPIPADLKGRFDAVCDIGTLEHVFDFPTAIRNCMEMVRVGGHLLMLCPANNFFGHGFYQFQPELFHRVFEPANGFQLEALFTVECGPRRRWYSTTDPQVIRARVTLVNAWPVFLFARARRVGEIPAALKPPQESDYVAAWNRQATHAQSGGIDRLAQPAFLSLKRWLIERLPRLARLLEAWRISRWNRDFSFRNRRAFALVRKRDVAKTGAPGCAPAASTSGQVRRP